MLLIVVLKCTRIHQIACNFQDFLGETPYNPPAGGVSPPALSPMRLCRVVSLRSTVFCITLFFGPVQLHFHWPSRTSGYFTCMSRPVNKTDSEGPPPLEQQFSVSASFRMVVDIHMYGSDPSRLQDDRTDRRTDGRTDGRTHGTRFNVPLELRSAGDNKEV